MLNFNPIDTPQQRIIDLIDQALIKQNSEQRPRDYLGASALGDPCSRKLQYQYQNLPKDPERHFSGQQLRIFERGHEMETMMAKYLRLAGFDLRTEKASGQQYGFNVAKGQIKGHVDGVILSGPDGYSYPMLWECKALKNSSWNDLNKKGLSVSKPIYAGQVALYQAYCQLHEQPAMFTALNADTMAMYIELVPFDADLAQRLSDKAVNILSATAAQETLPRIATDASWYQCKWCDYQDRCWESNP